MFKVGDKVELISNEVGFIGPKLGDRGTIVDIEPTVGPRPELYNVKPDEGLEWNSNENKGALPFFARELKLVPQPKFAVGDVVAVVSNHIYSNDYIGQFTPVIKVMDYKSGGFYYSIDVVGLESERYDLVFPESCLEKVDRQPEPKVMYTTKKVDFHFPAGTPVAIRGVIHDEEIIGVPFGSTKEYAFFEDELVENETLTSTVKMLRSAVLG